MIDELSTWCPVVLVAGAVLAGLQAGTYYAWASGVMPGLARVDDRTFVASVDAVNRAILNPVFLTSFVGAPLLAGVAIATTSGSARGWSIAALVLAVATVAVTAAGNVRLNDALAAAVDAAGGVDRLADVAAVRVAFESPWVRLNVVRTLTSAGALTCLAAAATR